MFGSLGRGTYMQCLIERETRDNYRESVTTKFLDDIVVALTCSPDMLCVCQQLTKAANKDT